MKGFTKFFAIFTVLYLAVWFTLSGTEAGVLTLQIGVKQNSPFLTRVFIALGANPKDTGQEGMSALHFASYLGADQVIPLLIEKGAPINSLDDLQGLKMRIAGLGGAIMQKIGVSSLILPPPEIFPALPVAVYFLFLFQNIAYFITELIHFSQPANHFLG